MIVLPPGDLGAAINLALSVVGVGIVAYITTRLAAQRAIKEEVQKQRHTRQLDRRLEWTERLLRASDAFILMRQQLMDAEAPGIPESERDRASRQMRDALITLSTELAVARIDAAPKVAEHCWYAMDVLFKEPGIWSAAPVGTPPEVLKEVNAKRDLTQDYLAKLYRRAAVAARAELGGEDLAEVEASYDRAIDRWRSQGLLSE